MYSNVKDFEMSCYNMFANAYKHEHKWMKHAYIQIYLPTMYVHFLKDMCTFTYTFVARAKGNVSHLYVYIYIHKCHI